MGENNKSSTKVVDIKTTPIEQIKNLIPIWSEGNPELEKTLYKLIEDGIETVGCCSGHDTGTSNDLAYVGLKFGRDLKWEIILNLLAQLDSEENKKITIGFVKGENLKPLCGLYAPNPGRDNGDFFRRINLAYSSEKTISDEKRAKYDALRTLLLDDRVWKRSRQLFYCIGDTNIQVIGIKGLEGKAVYVKVDTLLEKADWLKQNPYATVDCIFGKSEMTPIIYPMKFIKDFAEKSKQALDGIRKAYRKIRDTYQQQKGNGILGEEPEFDE